MKQVKWIRFLTIFTAILSIGIRAHAVEVDRYPHLAVMIDELVLETGIDRKLLNIWLEDAKIDQSILRIMERPAESLPWHKYQARFLNRKMIQNGKRYLDDHLDSFLRAEREFGISPGIVAAIIGVETRYGAVTGRRRVLDSLMTLSLEYPRRSKFFSSQLKEFLILSSMGIVDPLEIKGSYAGAIGIPQFMPTSYQAYAIDFDQDGYSDLVDSSVDAIGSVANYLKMHGWRAGEPIVKRLSPSEEEIVKDYVTKSLTADVPLTVLVADGIEFSTHQLENEKVGVIRLEYDGHHKYRIAYPNFFVLTRYNRSQNYAMTVFELAEKINPR